MGRADSLAKLAFAYGMHLTRRRVTRVQPQVARMLEMYGPDGFKPLTADEQSRHPQLVGCINCGLCALAAGRTGRMRPPDLAAAYMRIYARLGSAASDFEGDEPDWEAAAAACPVGVPLPEVATIVRRLAAG